MADDITPNFCAAIEKLARNVARLQSDVQSLRKLVRLESAQVQIQLNIEIKDKGDAYNVIGDAGRRICEMEYDLTAIRNHMQAIADNVESREEFKAFLKGR